jgi:hypothetical protein
MRLANCFVSAILSGALFVLLAGCEGDDGGGEVTRSFSVKFVNNYFRDGRGWVVVHTAGGDSSLSAMRAAGDGVVDLTTSGSRATFTVVRSSRPRSEFDDTHIEVTTYAGIPLGTFLARGPGMEQPLGWAAITISYPFGRYTDRLVSMANGVTVSPPIAADSILRTVMPIYQTEPDGTISIYATVQDSVSGYCGWLLDQTFLPGDTESYLFRLEQPVRHRTVTSSQPLGFWGLEGYRGSMRAPYEVSTGGDAAGLTNFDVFYGMLPVTRWNLWGIGALTGIDWHSAQRISFSVPSSLTMPEMTVTSNYDLQGRRFTSVAVSGTADILMCAWYGFAHGLTGEISIYWEVWTSPSSHTVGLPVLPDSVLTDLGFALDQMEPSYQLLWNFEPADGFEDLARKIYLSDTPWPAQFTDMQAYSTQHYALDRQIARSNDPTPIRLHHHQFR